MPSVNFTEIEASNVIFTINPLDINRYTPYSVK